jgi:hypothetical protein
MSDIFAEQLTAVANVVLAVFAIVTAVLAGLAFRKQAREVSDQSEMLDLQRKQLAEQEKTSAKQAEVLELQGRELRESIDERKREAEDKGRAQAAQVTAWFAWAQATGAAVEGFTAAFAWLASTRHPADHVQQRRVMAGHIIGRALDMPADTLWRVRYRDTRHLLDTVQAILDQRMPLSED